MEIQKKEWKTPVVIIISSTTDILGGAIPGYNEGTILGSKNGANPITFTIPASQGGYAFSRAHTKNQYLS